MISLPHDIKPGALPYAGEDFIALFCQKTLQLTCQLPIERLWSDNEQTFPIFPFHWRKRFCEIGVIDHSGAIPEQLARNETKAGPKAVPLPLIPQPSNNVS